MANQTVKAAQEAVGKAEQFDIRYICLSNFYLALVHWEILLHSVSRYNVYEALLVTGRHAICSMLLIFIFLLLVYIMLRKKSTVCEVFLKLYPQRSIHNFHSPGPFC